MRTIFISYRREDSSAACGRIYERLCNHFGRESIFKDVDDIPVGVNFRDYIAQQLAGCRMVLVAIGRYWVIDRLNDPDDYLRMEIEEALRVNVIVVPLLVDNRLKMPIADDLPVSIRDLCKQNAAYVRNDPDFDSDMQRLVLQLARQISGQPPTASYPMPRNQPSPSVAALEAQIEKLLAEVSAVGDGDLRVQAEVTPDTLGVVADSFNYMIEELAKVIARTRATAIQVTNATVRMADRATEVEHQARIAEGIAQATSRSTATPDEIKSAMNRIAEIAHQTSAMMQDANASLEYVMNLAEQLRASVATFRLPDGMNY